MTRLFRPRLAAALGVAAIAAVGCGSSSNNGGGGSSSSTNAVATQDPNAAANKGGTLTVATWEAQTSFLNAGIIDSQTLSYAIDAPSAEGLLWYKSLDETGSARKLSDYWVPWLATEVPTVENGDVKLSGCSNPQAKMCVTWKLRSDVTWHDGSKFTSHDVCDTFQFFWLKYGLKGGTNPTSLLSTSGWDQTLDCVENSPTQATVDWKVAYGPYLAIGTGVLGILPAKVLDAAFSANSDLEKTKVALDLTKGSGNTAALNSTDTLDNIVDGTGPYVLSSFDQNNGVTYVVNKNYWNKSHLPHIDKLVFKFVSAADEMEREAKAGEIDFGLDYRLPPLKDLQDYEKSSGKLHVEVIPDSGAEKMDINTCASTPNNLCGPKARKIAALGDPAFRHAMAEAINREQMVTTLTNGQSSVPADSFLYLGASYIRNPNVQTTAYDASKAASDFDAAGYKLSPSCGGGKFRADKTGACINLHIVTTKGNKVRQSELDAIQSDLQAAGVQVTQEQPQKAGQLFGAYKDGGTLYTHTFDLAVYTNTLSAPAEPDGFWPAYHADCGGSCPSLNQIPNDANQGQGQDDTGVYDPQLDSALDNARNTVNLSDRTKFYQQAETRLAADMPEIPLYQQITVNSYSSKLQGLKRNDVIWTYNSYDWYCTGGNCQG